MLYRMTYPTLLFVFFSICIALTTSCFASGTIIGSDPTLESAYDVKCNLNYQKKNPYEIASDFDDKYGIKLSVPIEAMNLCLKLEGDQQKIMDFFCGLFAEHSFLFALQGGSIDDWFETDEDKDNGALKDVTILVGLAGDPEVLKQINYLTKEQFPIKDSKESGLYIDLKGEQIPCWRAIGQIAQKSHLGIDYGGMDVCLGDNSREVIAYQEASPFYLYISKEIRTDKLIFDIRYDPKVVNDVSDVQIKNVCEHRNGKKQEISGSTLTTMSSLRYDGHAVWMSDGAVKWEEGMVIQGVIQGPVLTREYEVENLSKSESIKGDDLEISVKVSSDVEKVKSSSGVGVYFEPENIDCNWVMVKVDILNNLNETENTFLQMIDKKRQEGKDIPENEKLRYESLITEKMDKLEVLSMGKPVSYHIPESGKKYGGISSHYFTNGIDEIQVMFDSMQDGKEIFPLNMQLRRYEPKKAQFSVKIEK